MKLHVLPLLPLALCAAVGASPVPGAEHGPVVVTIRRPEGHGKVRLEEVELPRPQTEGKAFQKGDVDTFSTDWITLLYAPMYLVNYDQNMCNDATGLIIPGLKAKNPGVQGTQTKDFANNQCFVGSAVDGITGNFVTPLTAAQQAKLDDCVYKHHLPIDYATNCQFWSSPDPDPNPCDDCTRPLNANGQCDPGYFDPCGSVPHYPEPPHTCNGYEWRSVDPVTGNSGTICHDPTHAANIGRPYWNAWEDVHVSVENNYIAMSSPAIWAEAKKWSDCTRTSTGIDCVQSYAKFHVMELIFKALFTQLKDDVYDGVWVTIDGEGGSAWSTPEYQGNNAWPNAAAQTGGSAAMQAKMWINDRMPTFGVNTDLSQVMIHELTHNWGINTGLVDSTLAPDSPSASGNHWGAMVQNIPSVLGGYDTARCGNTLASQVTLSLNTVSTDWTSRCPGDTLDGQTVYKVRLGCQKSGSVCAENWGPYLGLTLFEKLLVGTMNAAEVEEASPGIHLLYCQAPTCAMTGACRFSNTVPNLQDTRLRDNEFNCVTLKWITPTEFVDKMHLNDPLVSRPYASLTSPASTYGSRTGPKLRVVQVVLFENQADIGDPSACEGPESDYWITPGVNELRLPSTGCAAVKDQKAMAYHRNLKRVQEAVNADWRVNADDPNIYLDTFPRCEDVLGNTVSDCADSCYGQPITVDTGYELVDPNCLLDQVSRPTCALQCQAGYVAQSSSSSSGMWVECQGAGTSAVATLAGASTCVPTCASVTCGTGQVYQTAGGANTCASGGCTTTACCHATCASSVACGVGQQYRVTGGGDTCPSGGCSTSACCEEIDGCAAPDPCRQGGDSAAVCADVVGGAGRAHTCSCSTGFFGTTECGEKTPLITTAGNHQTTPSTPGPYTQGTDLTISKSYSVSACVSQDTAVTGLLFDTGCAALELTPNGNARFRSGGSSYSGAFARRGFALNTPQRVVVVVQRGNDLDDSTTVTVYVDGVNTNHQIGTQAGISSSLDTAFFCNGASSVSLSVGSGGLLSQGGSSYVSDVSVYSYDVAENAANLVHEPCPSVADTSTAPGDLLPSFMYMGLWTQSSGVATVSFPSTLNSESYTLRFWVNPSDVSVTQTILSSTCLSVILYGYGLGLALSGPSLALWFVQLGTISVGKEYLFTFSVSASETRVSVKDYDSTIIYDTVVQTTGQLFCFNSDLIISDAAQPFTGTIYGLAAQEGTGHSDPAPPPRPVPTPLPMQSDTLAVSSAADAVQTDAAIPPISNGPNGDPFSFSVCIKPANQGFRHNLGYIWYNARSNSANAGAQMAMTYDDNGIGVRLAHGSNPLLVMLHSTNTFASRLDDGNWHSVGVTVVGSAVWVYVDEDLKKDGNLYVQPGALTSNPRFRTYLGAKHPSATSPYTYEGQVANLKFMQYDARDVLNSSDFYSCPTNPPTPTATPTPTPTATPTPTPVPTPPVGCADYRPAANYLSASGASTPIPTAYSNYLGSDGLGACDLETLHQECVDRVNMYRAGNTATRFSTASSATGGLVASAVAAGTLLPFAHEKSRNDKSSEAALGTAVSGGNAQCASLQLPHLQNGGGVKRGHTVCSTGTQGSTASTLAAARAEMHSLVQGMWDRGVSNEAEADFSQLVSTTRGSLSCGFGFDTQGRMSLHLDLYHPDATDSWCTPSCPACGQFDRAATCPNGPRRACACRDVVIKNLEVEILAIGLRPDSPSLKDVGVEIRAGMITAVAGRPVSFSGCPTGTWALTILAGSTPHTVHVGGSQCTSYVVRLVDSCSAGDYHCTSSSSNCGSCGVYRLEDDRGNFVSTAAASPAITYNSNSNGMLGCASDAAPTITGATFAGPAFLGDAARDVLLRYRIQVVANTDAAGETEAGTIIATLNSNMATITAGVTSDPALTGLTVLYSKLLPADATLIVGTEVVVEPEPSTGIWTRQPVQIDGRVPAISGDMTLSTCIRHSGGTSPMTILGNFKWNQNGYSPISCLVVTLEHEGKLKVAYGQNHQGSTDAMPNTFQSTSQPTLLDGQMHRVVVTVSGTMAFFYVDGVLVSTISALLGTWDSIDTCTSVDNDVSYLGASLNFNWAHFGYTNDMRKDFFGGRIYDTSMYSAALSDDQVAAIGGAAECGDGGIGGPDPNGDDDGEDGAWIGLSAGASFIIVATAYCYRKLAGNRVDETSSKLAKFQYVNYIREMDPSVSEASLSNKTTPELEKELRDLYFIYLTASGKHEPPQLSGLTALELRPMMLEVKQSKMTARLSKRPSVFL